MAQQDKGWRGVGTTQYRDATPADIVGAVVTNADIDAVYLEYQLTGQQFVVYLNGQGEPIQEYRAVEEIH